MLNKLLIRQRLGVFWHFVGRWSWLNGITEKMQSFREMSFRLSAQKPKIEAFMGSTDLGQNQNNENVCIGFLVPFLLSCRWAGFGLVIAQYCTIFEV